MSLLTFVIISTVFAGYLFVSSPENSSLFDRVLGRRKIGH